MYDFLVNGVVLVCVLHGVTGGPSSERVALPDLTVTGFGWIPEHPKVGDRVLFAARVKNIGSAPTPAGKVCGVAFSIGSGNPMFWSDDFKRPLAPGESVVLYPNGGVNGSPYWIASGGDKPAGIYANVNDARRFPESSWLNNIVVRHIAIRGAGPRPATLLSALPDLILTSVRFSPAHPRFGQAVSATVTVKNQGPVATPAGVPIGVGFYTNYLDTAVLFGRSSRRSLGPGESTTFRTTGGDHTYPWIPFPGRHHVVAYVNDVGKIHEADLENNLKDTILDVSDPRERTLSHLVATRKALRGPVFGDQMPAEPPWTHRDRAFDGDVDTTPISMSLKPVPLGMDFGPRGRTRLTDIAFYPKPYFETRMLGGRFQGSNASADGPYRDIAEIRLPPKMGWNFIRVHDSAAYRYVRYLAPAKSQGYVAEIKFFGPKSNQSR